MLSLMPDIARPEMGIVRVKGEPEAPDVSLPTLGGRTVTLSALDGQVVLLNFWATWCPAPVAKFHERGRSRAHSPESGLEDVRHRGIFR